MKSFLRLKFLSDKGNHALYGLIIFLLIWLVSIKISTAFYLTIVLAGLVEGYDKITKKGNPEFLDFIYTIILPLLFYIGYNILN